MLLMQYMTNPMEFICAPGHCPLPLRFGTMFTESRGHLDAISIEYLLVPEFFRLMNESFVFTDWEMCI